MPGELIDGIAQINRAVRQFGPVIVGKAGGLLTMERQHLGQAPELARRAKTTMYQYVDRLTGVQAQASVWIVGARPEARDAEGHVCGW